MPGVALCNSVNTLEQILILCNSARLYYGGLSEIKKYVQFGNVN